MSHVRALINWDEIHLLVGRAVEYGKDHELAIELLENGQRLLKLAGVLGDPEDPPAD